MSEADYATKCIPDTAGKLVTSTNKLCIGGSKEKDYPNAAKIYIIWGGSAFKFVRTADKIISISSLSGNLIFFLIFNNILLSLFCFFFLFNI